MTRRAFLHQQRKAFQALARPSLRLHDDPLYDEKGLPTDKRQIYLDGGRDDGSRDVLRCREYEELIEQTVLGVGLPIPAESTAFDVGARELFTLAREVNNLHVQYSTQAKKEVETRQIDDLGPLACLWCARLVTRVMGDRSISTDARGPTNAFPPEPVFRQIANGWEMAFEGQRSVVDHLKGFALIRTLLENPKCPFDAMTLMRSEAPGEIEQADLTLTKGFDGVEVLDHQAKQEYLRQVRQLQEKADEARLRGDQEQAEACEEEAKLIAEWVRRGVDRYGRPRKTGSDPQRARKAASGQFSRALRRIATHLPALATHLRKAVRRGREFVYRAPDDIRWVTR